MKRFFSKIARFFWSWGFLEFVIAMILLVIFLYLEEDWRGARAWAATKAEWEAKGESFDFNRLIPSPIPDDQNLAAIPLFKMEPDPAAAGKPVPLKLREALNEDHHGGLLPLGRVTPDELRVSVATAYVHIFPGKPPPADPLTQFEVLYPIIPELRAATAERPYCLFRQDYSVMPPWNRSFGLLTEQIGLSRLLALHTTLALEDKQPEAALDDIKINMKLAAGVARDPSIISELITIGMVAIGLGVIDSGLQSHAWNDAHLAALQSELTRIDFLSQHQLAVRGEVVTEIVPNFDYIQKLRPVVLREWVGQADAPRTRQADILAVSPYEFWPSGWLTENKVKVVDFLFRELAAVDPKSHRVFPEINRQLEREAEAAQALPGRLAPWNILFAASSHSLTRHTLRIAQIQAHLDEARIACALERYRLAHGVYPDSLDALAPACIDQLPHDIMNGQPYHYQLRPDGTFLLYSVGWNQTDDGGKVIFKKDAPTIIDYEQGDWVWPTPQSNPQK